VLIELWRWIPNASGHARTNARSGIRIRIFENFGNRAHETARHTCRSKSTDPMLGLHFFHSIGHARSNPLPMLQSSRIGPERIIRDEIVKTQRVRACIPLSIASNGYHERPVCRFE
jgi:hypothetical protein